MKEILMKIKNLRQINALTATDDRNWLAGKIPGRLKITKTMRLCADHPG